MDSPKIGSSALTRILLVDDFEPFRKSVRCLIRQTTESVVLYEVSDGLVAVQKAEELRPNLILLDIGLPSLNGIEVARQIRDLAPESKIIFVTTESSPEFVREALNLGAHGYVVKSRITSDLLAAAEAVLQGGQFVSPGLVGNNRTDATDTRVLPFFIPADSTYAGTERRKVPRNHAVQFYSDDSSFLVALTHFVKSALEAGNSVIVVATESHRDSVLRRLQPLGVDIGAAIEQGRYVSLDAAAVLSTFMVNDLPDPVRFLEVAGNRIMAAAKAAKGKPPRVAVCGECDPPLWTLAKGEAAIRMEQLWNEIAKTYDVDILCGYPLGRFHGTQSRHLFQRICAEHSAVL
jgi:DNA-binding NarL/FixJ family response regulator